MRKYRSLWLFLTLSLPLISTGCISSLLGGAPAVREAHLVYVRIGPPPAECQGVARLATNVPVPVTIDGDTATMTKIDAGGYLVIPEDHFAAIMRRIAELEANRQQQPAADVMQGIRRQP